MKKPTLLMNIKETDIIRQREYVSMDSYAYVVRDRKTNKLLVSGWSEKETEERLQDLFNKR